MARMSTEKFEQVVLEECEHIAATLTTKAMEYAHDDDRLHNFNQIAGVNDEPVEKSIWGMACKHLSCVLDLVHGRKKDYDRPYLDEKIGDFINYLIILKAHFYNEIEIMEKVAKAREAALV